ncbi:putative E3 ubiquitin-protein ligase ubr7 [Phtheirospermum japonicum]|uniref:Putative E3 ubiquitin-protein ligase ubr7 n=1 Tax=Phtheirospermum japonicum TaxID=374723 RepID=A0A830BBH4_9LAMI|nr:putative E3 ubiquitin-protein ligase ubr7 [Phtheirospermum japonicum]
MSDAFDDEVDAELTISIGDYLKAVEEEELPVLYPAMRAMRFWNYGPKGISGVIVGIQNLGSFTLYPDPNVEEQVEMIQCCVCEDWFHEEHMGLQPSDKIPRDEEGEPLYMDFICQGCAPVCSFLNYYPHIISAPDTTPDTLDENAVSKNTDSVSPVNTTNSATVNNVDVVFKECNNTEAAGPSTKCMIEDLVGNPITAENSKPLFLFKNWREILCICEKCSDLYAQKGISFLPDKEDSIAEYERMAKQRRSENMQKQEGAELNFLNNLGHVEKMEILSGIADMKNEIFSFLESSDPSKAITTADVQQVFENLAKKRKRSQ